MDIGMPRADYDKFIEDCKTDLGPEFLLQTWDTDPRYPFPLGKMRLKRTHAQEKFAPEGTENGIFVDLYPLDAVLVVGEKRVRAMHPGGIVAATPAVRCDVGCGAFSFLWVDEAVPARGHDGA